MDEKMEKEVLAELTLIDKILRAGEGSDILLEKRSDLVNTLQEHGSRYYEANKTFRDTVIPSSLDQDFQENSFSSPSF